MAHLVFVYGTLKRNKKNHHLIKGERFLGEALLRAGHTLMYQDHPCLIESESKTTVFGELFDVSDQCLMKLDELEEHPTWYERRVKTVKLIESGEERQAWVYIFPKSMLKESHHEIHDGRYE